ncbi:hypothetical protein EB061_05030 [bacterium]|nr:hypothetical protein [bacterium]
MNANAPVIVLGDGSSSVFLIQQLLGRGERVVWVEGSGSKLLPVMPQVKSERAIGMLATAAAGAGIGHSGRIEKGFCHRVFRSKAFKLPLWNKAVEQTWAPELLHLGDHELRVEGLDPVLIEESLRVSFEGNPMVTRVQSAPVIEFEVHASGGKIQFSNGLLTEFKQFYFCDDLSILKGFPKLQTIFKNQMKGIRPASRFGALQVVFHHSTPLKQFFNRGLVIPMNRESGESFDRNVLGWFVEPNRSIWTVYLQPSECEENHEIMKKLRKLKQALNRAFESPEFLPEGKTDFLATVEREQVRFEENALWTEGSLVTIDSNPDFTLVPDAFGLTATLARLASHFGIPSLEDSITETSTMDLDSIEVPAYLNVPVDIRESLPSTEPAATTP